ncbi:nuclear transport factor 2 family protein [Massilia sp. IC2-477]|uniref:nuclear transport factor 2 family protein n=1 Tax=Massilia sp. IC2-477 TaxID=2887198 RepID=UPI001D11CEFB|nr:nuclear transport factor 2 family protein [Massilia sp. IC2-477]MCC2958603.1 nuclear transport factor 2 family protein [Massilia sp. IC2-477]
MNTLPTPIAAYVAASNARDPQAIAACFTPDATVRDEGGVHQGRAQIASWARETGQRYRSTIEPAAIDELDGGARLQAVVRGDFPGNEVRLAFRFTLAGDHIAALEIAP